VEINKIMRSCLSLQKGKLPHVISGIYHDVNETCTLLRFYAAQNGSSVQVFGTELPFYAP